MRSNCVPPPLLLILLVAAVAADEDDDDDEEPAAASSGLKISDMVCTCFEPLNGCERTAAAAAAAAAIGLLLLPDTISSTIFSNKQTIISHYL